MADPLTQLLTLLQGNRGWGPDVQLGGVRPDYGLGAVTGLGQTAKSPYERTLRPGETRSSEDLQDMLAEVILAGGAGASPLTGLTGRQQARQALARSRSFTSPVVYHGTTEPIEKFNVPKGRGTFFTDKPADAAVFAGSGTFSGEGYAPATPGANIIPAKVTFRRPEIIDLGGRVFDPAQMDRLVAKAEQSGADGLIIKNLRNFPGADPSTSYVALKPGQIRSAITKKRM